MAPGKTLRSRVASLALALIAWLGAGVAHARPASMSLDEAYRLALTQSEQVTSALANRDLADALHTGALTIMGPSVYGTVKGVYENGQTVVGQPAQILKYGEVDVVATIPLFRRQIFDARRATALGTAGAEEQLRRARQQLMFDVATAFIGVLRNRQQVAIAQAAVKRAETQLQSATNRVKAQAALKTAELLAQIDLQRAQTQVNTAIGALHLAESSFERLMGVPPPEALVLPPTPPIDGERDLIELSRRQRPDVRALHLFTQQSQATVSQLQSRIFWPTLDANFLGTYQMLPEGGIPGFTLYGTLTLPLFMTGDEWVQVRLQRQRVRVAAANESLLRRQVGDDVRQALSRLQTAKSAMEIAAEQLKTATKNYELVSSFYKLGAPGTTLLELVTAQAAVFEAETNRVLASFDREQAVYQLLLAEGKIDL